MFLTWCTRSKRPTGNSCGGCTESPWSACGRRAIEQIRAATSDRSGDYHSCFLEVFALVNERHRELACTFDDLRRSTATLLLASMIEERLLSEEEFSQFGPETRGSVEALLRLRGAASTSR